MLYAKPWEHCSAVVHCLSSFSSHLESTLPPAVQLLLSKSQQVALVGHHLRLSNVAKKVSRPSYETLHVTRQTLPTVNRKHFFMNILRIDSFYLKTHNRTPLFGSTHKHGRHFDYWNQHARLLPRLSWIWTVLLPSDTHIKPIASVTAVLLPSRCASCCVLKYVRVIELPSPQQRLLGLYL
jgi:hypothetical protein